MSTSELAARMLVQVHLGRREMPAALHDAMVETVQSRVLGGARPYLTTALQADIDRQATGSLMAGVGLPDGPGSRSATGPSPP